ncbi:hypothetical protein L3X38_023795 [Prunus dulcis]|uniref:Phytocyanin domain-containing protein n=1 Tax=Prunus dulcis TaxID=3755 RepID=A0AAD4VYQ6_PRUDU|nr:mavicyanin-like [Prunus dulcis]KAI5333663.1 hypothetical protein L3X38_023795 [Prunus dulcis]
MALYGVCFGAVYRVGDSNGWTSRGLVDYNEWASTKDFHVNDTLIFTYNNQFHNVMQVTNQDFQSCNTTSAMATYTSGSDTVTLNRSGHFYFLCGTPGHCQAGQNVDINVTLPISADGSFASPILAPYGASPSSEVVFLSSASTLHLSKLEFTTVVLCVLGFVL